MKNETARREIESLDYYLQNHTNDYSEESHMAMMMAIKALEQQPCEDCISREAVRNTIFAECSGTKLDIDFAKVLLLQRAIKSLPSVTPKPKMGRWIFDEILDKHYFCSECKAMGVDYWDYCPNCGAKMAESEVN